MSTPSVCHRSVTQCEAKPRNPPSARSLIACYRRDARDPIARQALHSSINPNPFFIRRGFRPLPKPLANLWQGDVIDSGQRPPYVKVLVWLAEPLPLRGEPWSLTSLLSPPLEKGLKERERETTSTGKASNGKGAQRERRQAPQKLQAGRVLNRGDDKHRKSFKREGCSICRLR